MASIHKEILIDASSDHVWDALRDFGALHTRLAPGFVTDTRLDGDAPHRYVFERYGRARNPGRLRRHASGGWPMPSSANASGSTAPQHRFSPKAMGAPASCGLPMCCRTRSRPIWTRRWISACSPCRSHWDAAPHDIGGFSMPSARTAPRPTAPAGWISTAASSAPGISMSGNFPKTARERRRAGEWHFGWALEGRAIQDVWIVPPRGELRHGDAAANFNSYGATLRVYDPDIDAWRIQWTDPVTRNFLQMIGRAEGRDIVQLGTRPDGQLARWRFSDITADFISLARRSLGGCWRNMARHHRVHRPPEELICLGMISAQTRSAFVARENRCPLFRIMLSRDLSHRSADTPLLASARASEWRRARGGSRMRS